MDTIGLFSLSLAWLLTLVGFTTGAIAGCKESAHWFRVTKIVTLSCTALIVLSTISLGALFFANDYTNQYVWQYSNKDMLWYYRVSAIWGGMDGSMLLWCCMLAVSIGLVALKSNNYSLKIKSWVLSVLHTALFFFTTIVVWYTNPFRYLASSVIPIDGNGLNPLLQNPYMAIHPPTLYLGFTTLAVPYAFCIAALLAKDRSDNWLDYTRSWTLIGWAFLTAGIMLGGHWAYLELGWGGFWAWDPVENASFLPWLTATAFLHSVMVQKQKQMFKIWNVALVPLTYGLTVFGTFLTRSGIVQSVHAFASTDIGVVFLQYLAFITLSTVILVFMRRDMLKAERSIESYLSREAAFLLNNLILLSIMFATLWGVMFPILSEAVTGEKMNVGIPFFNAVNVPLFLALLLTMGIGTLIAWRKASISSLKRIFLWPALISFAIGAILLWAGVRGFYPITSYCLCMFVISSIMSELHRGTKAVKGAEGISYTTAATKHVKSNQRRYAGYFVHIGVAIAAVGITASMAHKVEQEFSLKIGETYKLGRFVFELSSLVGDKNDNFVSDTATLDVRLAKDNSHYTTLKPEKRFYLKKQEPTTEVAIKNSLREDLYVAFYGVNPQTRKVSFKAFINPLQVWLWFGGIIIIIGTILALLGKERSSIE